MNFFQKLLESRIELRPVLLSTHGRSKDLLFLDLALSSSVRTTMERGLKNLSFANPPVIRFQHHLCLLCTLMLITFFPWIKIYASFCDDEQEMMFFISLVLEDLCLSMVNNQDFIYCTKVYLYAYKKIFILQQKYISLFYMSLLH